MTGRRVMWVVGFVVAALVVLAVALVFLNNVTTVTGH